MAGPGEAGRPLWRRSTGDSLTLGWEVFPLVYNMGFSDRWIRAALALVLMFVGAAAGGAWAVVLFILTALLMGTAVLGYCPLYGLLHITTYHPRPRYGLVEPPTR